MKKLLIVFMLVGLLLGNSYAEPAIVLSTTTVQGGSPDAVTFHIQNSGGSVLNYSITSDQPWVIPGTDKGGTTEEGEKNVVKIVFNTGGLAIGTYVATITISDPLAENDPQTVQVNLLVTPPPIIGISL